MYIITPFVPNIVEHLPERKVIHDNYEGYLRNRTTGRTARTPRYECSRCGKSFESVANASRVACEEVRWNTDYSVTKNSSRSAGLFSYYGARRSLKIIETHDGHKLVAVSKVATELGDDLGLYEPKERARPRRYQISFESWMSSRVSPDNRGLLSAERVHNEWMRPYRHYPEHYLAGWWYRRPKTLNERRQFEASQVDDLAPDVRGKRRPRNLPNTWDDIPVHRDKSWKRRKVRRQWMVNAG